MSTVELIPTGIESIKVIPESGLLRVQVQFRALAEGTAESIAMDVVLPAADRSFLSLQSEAITRAQWLLEGFLAQNDQQQAKSMGPIEAETAASLSPPSDGRSKKR
jgi:hypothetical protein